MSMKAVDFMHMTLCESCMEVYQMTEEQCQEHVTRVKFVGRDADRLSRGPSILWWVSYLEREPWIDGAAPANGIGFRIECRAENIVEEGSEPGAAALLDRALEKLAPYLIAIEDQYDEEDSPSQQRLDYFACVARVILPEMVEVDVA